MYGEKTIEDMLHILRHISAQKLLGELEEDTK